MSDAPAYIATRDVGGAPPVGLQPTAIPQFPNEVAPALAQFGDEANKFAQKLEIAKTAATATNSLSDYLTKLDAAKAGAMKDPDWQNAPQKFQSTVKQLQDDALSAGNLDQRTQAMLRLHMTHATIAAGNVVQNAAINNGANGWLADYETAAANNQNEAATAGSPIQRQTAIDRNSALIQTGVAAGFITQAKAVEMDQRFRGGLDHADALRLVATDPRAAATALSDPNRFTALNPVQRQTYIDTAHQKADTDAAERARGIVAGQPYSASLIAGQFVDSSHIDQLFNRGVIPAESNGQNAPPNSKGAFGPAQITPGFARDYIGQLPAAEQAAIGDVKGMSDEQLTQKLMANPKVSIELGNIGFHALVAKYNGNPVLALAAYNAGPLNADRWQAAAQKQFGPNPTPEQLASVIDFKETRDYVTKIYAGAGARMDAFGVSPGGRYHLGITLGTELTEQATRAQHVLNQLASVTAASDPVPKLVQEGIDVAPDRIAQYRSAQAQAAAGGDLEAARKLHDLDFALQVKPQIDRLYAMPFGVVNGLVDAAQAQAKAPGANYSADQVQTLAVLTKTRDAINTARVENPTGLLVRAKLAPYVPVDPAADPGDQNFRAALTMRGGQAVQAQQLYGGTARALTPDEATSLKQRYAAAPAGEQFAILRSLATSLPQAAYQDTVKQVVGDDAAATIVGQFARARPDLAEQMLDGARLMKERGVVESQKAVRPVIAAQLKGQLYPAADQQSAVVTAAEYLDMARRDKRGALYNADDTSGVKQALEDVTGALTSRNGVQVAAPPGMKAGTFTAVLDHLDQHDVDQMGGAYDRGGIAVAPAELAANAVLRQTAPGSPRYFVGNRDAAAKDNFMPYFTGGERPGPLVFDMRVLGARADLKTRGIVEDASAAGAGPGPAAMRNEHRARAGFATGQ